MTKLASLAKVQAIFCLEVQQNFLPRHGFIRTTGSLNVPVKFNFNSKNLIFSLQHASTTSGIPGGYRLVSTYDLTHFPKWGGGYSGVNFGHLKTEVFRNLKFSGGGYSGVNFGHLKTEVF